MSEPPRTSLQEIKFGVFLVDLQARELRKGGTRVKLQDRPFEILLILLEQPGRVVSRQEIKDRLWPTGTFVDFDHGISSAVRKLREALSDSASTPRYIETVGRQGYRFIYPVAAHPAENGDFLDHSVASTTTLTAATTQAETSEQRWFGGRLWWRIGALATAVLCLAIVSIVISDRQHSIRLGPGDLIVVADLANSTGDPSFDDTLKQALTVTLEQSPFLTIVPDRVILHNLRLMGRQPEQPVTPTLARGLCERVGAKAYVAGWINSVGDQYLLGLNATNCATGIAFAQEEVQVDRKDAVLRRLGAAASQLRKKLGESLPSIQQFDKPAEEVTTPSLDALKAFTEGRKASRLKGEPQAIPFYEKAIALDPRFAAAEAALGVAYIDGYQTSRGIAHLRRAFELSANLSDRERFHISSAYFHLAVGDLEEARTVYKEWMHTYPSDLLPFQNIAAVDGSLGRYDDAIAEGTAASHINPENADIYTNIAQDYMALGRTEEARKLLLDAQSRGVDSMLMHLMMYYVGFFKLDNVLMQQQLAWVAGRKGEEDWLLSAQSDTDAYFGRLRIARDYSDRAVTSAKLAQAIEAAAEWKANAALREAEFGNYAAARRGALAAVKLAGGKDVSVVVAMTLARCGDPKGASMLLDKLSTEFPRDTMMQGYSLPSIRAAIDLANGKPRQAVADLQPAEKYELGGTQLNNLYPVYLRGQAYVSSHDGILAGAEFQKMIDHKGVGLNFPINSLAYLGLARSRAIAGDRTAAIRAYKQWLLLWKDADPDIPILKQARKECDRLQ